MNNLYDEVIELDINHDNHESDLYLPVNDITKKLLIKHGGLVSTFISQIDGKQWFDVPFQYMPFWDKKCKQYESDEASASNKTMTFQDIDILYLNPDYVKRMKG